MLACTWVIGMAACGPPPTPAPPPPTALVGATEDPLPPPPPLPARSTWPLSVTPMHLLVVGPTLYFVDSAGGVFSMPATGGAPQQLSEQHHEGFAFSLFTAAGEVLATDSKGFFFVAGPDGPVTRLPVSGLASNPEEAVGDSTNAYVTLYNADDVWRVPPGGGAATRIAPMHRGVLGIHGATVYAASYTTGTLVAIPTAVGGVRVLARGLPKPTAVAADDTAVYVYTEKDESIHRIALADGRASVIATKLVNADVLVVDEGWIYTRSWGEPSHTFVRVPADGSGPPQVLADGLSAPYAIAASPDAIFLVNRDAKEIIRFEKSMLPAYDAAR